ncbi:MAG: haloacid dehalogenase-like hydrolase [Rhodocyclales bacterium]|nr:haloacid dehalogenase-like hydrolase [Rhodocyclales bacterium]
MRIGLDFDNTIVSYDALFHKVALEQGVVPQETAVNKLAVRDHLRAVGKEDVWTAMQGYVYGARMDEAQAYPGLHEALRAALDVGHTLCIVSHKTRHPFLGPQYDLHAAARSWIERHLLSGKDPLVDESAIFFELTKPEKIARIAALECDVFVDDLPEILLADGFLPTTRRLLFDPEAHHTATLPADIDSMQCWPHFGGWLRTLQ